ncbi:MAG: enoyl-CoA hydratase-related protein, partial [Candidatus Neomarinimicrobiota bacterium]|nr:enoyl-CoA hydratase-related protein [Candidatus Neomarinimicrobiota bacterium]
MEYIIKKIDSNIGRLTINRPDSLNAMNKELIEQLMVSTQEMIDDSSVGVIIITGSGDKSFIAGADIKKMQ